MPFRLLELDLGGSEASTGSGGVRGIGGRGKAEICAHRKPSQSKKTSVWTINYEWQQWGKTNQKSLLGDIILKQ